MSKVVRSVKNVTKGYTTAQVKVRNATSNDAWGPVGSDMAEIAQMTFDVSTFYEIMDILDKRLNDKGKNWRHVLKSLKVLDYCLHEGSEHVVTWSRKNIYIIKTLREFQHIDEDNKDVGQNIRVSAKELTSLILNEERLRAERQDRRNWKSRVTGLDDFATHAPPPDQGRSRHKERRERGNEDDDLEYRLALEASKNEAEEDARRRQTKGQADGDDSDLAKAIKLSKEEEELRRRELEDANAQSLFDDTPAPQPAAAQPTGWNQGYQQQPAVDWFGNAIDSQQQQQPTGYGMPQQTGYQNGFGYPSLQQQQTGYQNPAMTGFMQPQQTAFHSNNPYSQGGQPNGLDGFGQQQQQSQDLLNPGSNNPWAGTNAAQELKPAPTGSNNPFASGFGKPVQQQQQTFKAPSLNTLAEQQATTSFNPIMNYQATQQQPSTTSPSSSSFPVQPSSPTNSSNPQNPHHARLNQLLASGEGQDTFGNVGDMRIPAQHTAPGVFVNSAGAGAQRLTSNATGNPFMQSQFTGMPNTTGFGANRQMPAQTGPAVGGSANPFGGAMGGMGGGMQHGGGGGGYGAFGGMSQQQQGQQQGQQGHGGSLIDL